MKDHRRKYNDLFGKPTTAQKLAEKYLCGKAGLEKFKDVLVPRENILSEEHFKKYIYDKPAAPYPQSPYRLERPHSPYYNLKKQANNTIRKILRRVGTFAKLIDSQRS